MRQGVVALPGSKSISNRTLLLAALAQGTTTLDRTARGRRHDADARRAARARRRVGATRRSSATTVPRRRRRVSGRRRRSSSSATRALSFRPLTAALAMSGGHYRADGVPRMHERPIGDLVDALRALGCDDPLRGERRISAAARSARGRRRRRRPCASAATCRASS